MVQLRHIEACHAVFPTGAISRAAKLLGVSQPAASKLVKHTDFPDIATSSSSASGRPATPREDEVRTAPSVIPSPSSR
jgi:hypothetical protein